MELPKLNYDDFYKFIMSIGLILVVFTGIGILFLLKDILYVKWIISLLIALLIFIFLLSAVVILLASKKCFNNQKITDKILEGKGNLIEKNNELKELEIRAKKRDFEMTKFKNKKEQVFLKPKISNFKKEPGVLDRSKIKPNIALVSYKITSVLPNSVLFNFLKEWKVWFWIANREPKKYKAYVKIKFITDDTEKEISDGYYGGTQAWKLDAFSGIQAPGLAVPNEIKVAAKEGKRVKIQINCQVKDENDNLIEEKFPQTYVYEPQNNSWFLEP